MRMMFVFEQTRRALIFPLSFLVIIPAIILLTSCGKLRMNINTSEQAVLVLFAVAVGACGVWLTMSAIALFEHVGQGSILSMGKNHARTLITVGVYRHMRNPMILGVVLMLVSEALFFRSWALAGWVVIFTFLYHTYLVLFEEPRLELLFGPQYVEYKKAVPRWIRW